MTRKLFSILFMLSCLLVQVRYVFACDVLNSQLTSCCCPQQASDECEEANDCQQQSTDNTCCEIDTSITAGTSTLTGDYIQVLDGNTVNTDLPLDFFLAQALFDLPPPQTKIALKLHRHTDRSAGRHTYLKTRRLRI